jgi:hypothetical protein
MIIYRIFNKINGKSYIGQSIFKFNKRYKGGDWLKELNITPRKITWCIKKNNLDTSGKNYWQTNK